MRPQFVRPAYTLTPDRVLSATSERGLTVAPPLADEDNDGALVLRASGLPTAAASIDVRALTGGAPVGYSIPYAAAAGTTVTAPGVAVAWKVTGDADTLYRGYSDTPKLVKIMHPITWDASADVPSTPRELPDGYLGIIVPSGSTATFWRVSPAGVATSSSISHGASAGWRCDFVVLPSGRLVSASAVNDAVDGIRTSYSDDYGVTWSALGYSSGGSTGIDRKVLCLEYANDMIVAVRASISGATTASISISLDGGCTFSGVAVETSVTNPRTCVLDGVIHMLAQSGILAYDRRIVPGGGCSTSISTANNVNTTTVPSCAIATRDDGTLWSIGWQASAAGTLDAAISCSTDGGLTWTQFTGAPFSLDKTGYATDGMDGLAMGMWQGSMVLAARARSVLGSNNGIHLLILGEWATVTDSTAINYKHSYVPFDFPHAVGWTLATAGGGATLSNLPWLNIVSTGAANSQFTSSAAWWTNATGGERTIRARVRVNSGGATTDNRARLYFAMNDGVNTQAVGIRLSTTKFRAVDSAGTQIGSDLTLTATAWTDLVIGIKHDYTAGVGRVSIWYRQDGTTVYTAWITAAAVTEVFGAADQAVIGSLVTSASNYDIAYIGSAEVCDIESGFTSPNDLTGRQLSAAHDALAYSGVRIGARNLGAIPGDLYTVATTYQYAKEDIWRELRPSRRVESTGLTDWAVVFDAGASDRFQADIVAVFGTNFRRATFAMGITGSPFAATVSVTLDATLYTGTVQDEPVDRRGRVTAAGSKVKWRPGQWRSDGDAHRYFVELYDGTNYLVYEITDNDETSLFIEGADLDSIQAASTFYIFGDKMAAPLGMRSYRYAQLSIAAQNTADAVFRVGTVILGEAFTPSKRYDENFTDRLEPNVIAYDTDAGYSGRTRRGPRKSSVQIQWAPINGQGPARDLAWQVRDFYAAIEGNLQPIVFWRDPGDVASLMLCYVEGVFALPNLKGEGIDALTRIDQLELRECL